MESNSQIQTELQIQDCMESPSSFFFFLFSWSRSMWDLSSPARDRTVTACIGSVEFNHWTAREVPERF